MTSFQLSVSPHRRAAARFVDDVQRSIQKAFAQSPDISQTDIANALGVHRSVINRQLRGTREMSLSRAAELSCIMGYAPIFTLEKPTLPQGSNVPSDDVRGFPSFEVKQSSTGHVVDFIPAKDINQFRQKVAEHV